MKVILDTNFLLMPESIGVDIFTKIREFDPFAELFVVDATIGELKKLMERRKYGKAAKIGLQLVEQQKIKIIKTEKNKNTDLIIAEKAQKGKYAVATQDKELKRLLKKNNVPVLALRQKNYIQLE
ncbi:nucleotide-binding protein [Candidatus Woesearchaeota archaeon]|nr:nucleotide-binding protein [Candidatus Woesearchaeota archaeon]MBW3017494.1 nucleotide-binding protein [Candidatus Woesearchaeota archaeon]